MNPIACFLFQSLTLITVCSCSAVKKEAAKFITICYESYDNPHLTTLQKEELKRLIAMAKIYTPVFTCMGLFEIRPAILLSIVSVGTNYFIVLLQLRSIGFNV